jgi:hypothetical protein
MRCSFCEQPLACQACDKPFVPPDAETHQALYQPGTPVSCPECEEPLVCRSCGFKYGGAEPDEAGEGETAGP